MTDEDRDEIKDSTSLARPDKLTLSRKSVSERTPQTGNSPERKLSGRRYVVTPKTSEDASEEKTPVKRQRGTGSRGQGGSQRSGENGNGRGRGGVPVRGKPPQKPLQKKLPDDPDHQWLKNELKAAETVAHVIARKAQFENKIRALKLRHAVDRPLYHYAERMEQLLQRLQTYPWTSLLRDIRRDDAVVKKLKL